MMKRHELTPGTLHMISYPTSRFRTASGHRVTLVPGTVVLIIANSHDLARGRPIWLLDAHGRLVYDEDREWVTPAQRDDLECLERLQ